MKFDWTGAQFQYFKRFQTLFPTLISLTHTKKFLYPLPTLSFWEPWKGPIWIGLIFIIIVSIDYKHGFQTLAEQNFIDVTFVKIGVYATGHSLSYFLSWWQKKALVILVVWLYVKALALVYEKNAITRDIRTILTPDGPNPARSYGLPKIHNALVDGLPNYKPIISQIGSPTCKIAKYFLDFISPITQNEYTLKDSFVFLSNSFMCSFDIDSLFTNILLEETIEIVIKSVFGRKRKINGLNKSDFRDLLK